MWVLAEEESGDPSLKSYAILPGQVYNVGRAPSSEIRISDPSVSRTHASLRILNGDILIKDEGSAYGTYVGEEAILSSSMGSQKDRITKSKDGLKVESQRIRIRFGLHSSLWVLIKQSNPKVSSSALSRGDKAALSRLLSDIFSKENVLIDEIKDDVTHLVMKEVLLTVKVASALAKGIPIVTPIFWTDFKACSVSKQFLPDPTNYIPPLKESSINSEAVSLNPNPERSSLFKDKTFLFKTKHQSSRFEDAIHYAGGKCIVSRDSESLEEVITIRSGSSNEGVPESHIGLAILFNSMELYCNPGYKPKVLSKPSSCAEGSKRATLAPETQKNVMSEPICSGKTKIISTLPSGNFKSSSSNMQTVTSIKTSTQNLEAQWESEETQYFNKKSKRPSNAITDKDEIEGSQAKKSKTCCFDDDEDLFSFVDTKKPSQSQKSKIEPSDDEEDLFSFKDTATRCHPPLTQSLKKRKLDSQNSNKEGEIKKFKVNDEVLSHDKKDGIESDDVSHPNLYIPLKATGDSDGFILKPEKTSVEDVEDDLSKSYILLEIADLIRSDLPSSSSSRSKRASEKYEGPNFKKFRSKSRSSISIPPKRITDLCKPEEFLSYSGNSSRMDDFFEEDGRHRSKNKDSQESEDFWNFESSKNISKKKQTNLRAFFK